MENAQIIICSKTYSVEFSNDFALMFVKWIFQIAVEKIKSNLWLNSLHYVETCNDMVGPISTSLRLRATQLRTKKCRSGGKPLATLYSIWPAWDLNLWPPAPETNALLLDQQGRKIEFFEVVYCTVVRYWYLRQNYISIRKSKLNVAR